jgi:LmbE family N-acetylglucosaminyl deacetylase
MEPLTLMAVHAHPDDECSSTGGVLARYSAEGDTTIVVTCTNGEYGDGPGGVKPGEAGHDPEAVARTRRDELERACKILGVTHIEMLGYHDSGMPDWDFKDRAEVFCNVALDEGADRLGKLLEVYRPDVVITYDDGAGYQHPDHLHVNKVTMAAIERTGIPQKAYYTAIRRSAFQRFREILDEQGIEIPGPREPDPEWIERMDALEARISTEVDIEEFVALKRRALGTHASQIEESWWSKLPEEAYGAIFGRETFIRVLDTTGVPIPEDDLFAGLR